MKLMTAVLLVGAMVGLTGAAELMTPWELDPESTPRYGPTLDWCRQLADAHGTVTLTEFGTSPQGRSLPLVIWDADGLADPEAVQAADRLVLLVQACIHAGESCGKDAGLTLVRDLAEQGGPAGLTLLFIPIFNVDGHERFGPYHRANQDGPREMGWRTTAQNLNLNRDFLKADAPEMQAWLRLWNRWSPDFMVDIHSTDGADYQYAITYGLELHGNLEAGLTGWLDRYLVAMEQAMAADGYPLAPYVSFRRWHDPRSGLRSWVADPRYSQGYAAVRNRPALLIEAHMLKPYPVRVEATRRLLDHTIADLVATSAELKRLIARADAHTASAAFRAEPLPLRWQATDQSRPFTFLGVEYEVVTSELSGGEYFIYHADRPDTFEVASFDQPVVAASATVPEAYLVPPQWTEVVERLRWHGVRLERLSAAVELEVDGWRLADCTWRHEPYEGRHPVTCEAQPVRQRRVFPAGTWLVDTAQAEARAIVHLLDPSAPDALLGWGFFDAILTRTEYIESYVIERLMAEMVADRPALRDSLEARKARDPEFAANPWAIRDWFYRQTPYYDQEAFVYPVAAIPKRAQINDLPRSGEF
jgi:hypothetical protein